MKKIVKASLLLTAVASLGMMSANAKVMKAADIEKALTDANGDSDVAFIFGKHVYVNRYTMADSVDAANTLNGQTDAILVLKNGENKWTNAITGEEIKNFEMEMIKIIGEPNENGFVSYDKNLNTDGSYVEQVKRPNSSIVEDVFLDETSPIQITGIRALQKVVKVEDGTSAANDIHAYNTEAMKVTFKNGILTLTQETPLLKYTNPSQDDTTEQAWYGLLIKTNKPIDDTVTLKIADTPVDHEDLVDATVHGGDKSEVMVWVKADTFASDKTIAISSEDELEPRKITVNPVDPTTVFQYEIESTDKVAIDTKKSPKAEEVKVVKTGEKNIAIFYSNSEEELDGIYFTLNGDNKYIYNDTTDKVVDLITVKDASFVAQKDDKFTTVSKPTAGDGKTADYVVTITTTKDLTQSDGSKKANIKLDFGTAISATSEATLGIPEKNNYNATITFAKGTKETIVTFTNTAVSDAEIEDKVSVKFVLVENIPKFELKTAKLIKPVDHIDSTLDDTNSWGAVDAVIKSNLKLLNTPTISTNAETKAKDTINIQAIDTLELLKTAVDPYDEKTRLYALVLDFGVDREFIELETDENCNALGIDNKDNAAIKLNTYGVDTDTAFVVILDADVKTLTFKNRNTNTTAAINVKLTEVKYYSDADTLTKANKVTISDEYKSSVAYADTNKFKVNEDVENFKATVDGKEYSYTCSGKTCTKAEALTIKSVRVVADDKIKGFSSNKGSDYNQKSITVKATGKDEISVTINRTMSKITLSGGNNDWVALLVEFNQDIYGKELSIEDESVIINPNIDKYKDKIKALLTEDEAENATHYAVIWVHSYEEANEFAIKEGTVKHTMTVTTTKVANATDLKVDSVHTVATSIGNTTLNNLKEKTALLYNLAGIKKVEKVDNNTIRITVDKAMTDKDNTVAAGFREVDLSSIVLDTAESEKTGVTETLNTGKYIAIAANLHSNTTLGIAQKNYKEHFEAKSNETLIWVDLSTLTAEDCGESKAENKYCTTVTYTNGNKENKYNTSDVTIEVVDTSKDMKLTNVKKVSSSSVPASIVSDKYINAFKYNQDRFGITFESKDAANTLTINALKEGNEFLPYSIAGRTSASDIAWYGVEIDFGTTLVPYDASGKGSDFKTTDGNNDGKGLYYELKAGSKTTYILWIQLNYTAIDTEKDPDGKVIVFQSAYDDSKQIKLNVVSDWKNVAK